MNLSGPETRSADGANENAVVNATVFVYQDDGSGEVPYETLHTTSGSVDAHLYFNDATDYTYRFEAYANMGELASAPSEVSFSGESIVSGAQDALLVSEVNQVIGNRETCSVPHYLYGYGAEGSALVLECEWAGQTMYYHLDCGLEENGSVNYSLSIHQTGSSEPLGGMADDALQPVSGMLQSADWREADSEASFGEASFGEAPAPVGASVYGTDGSFYTAEEWTSSGKSGSEAVGVAVSDGEHSFVIHPTAEEIAVEWLSIWNVVIDGVVTTKDRTAAEADFAGAANTAAVLAAVEAGTLDDAITAQYAASITFANGKSGYLPSAGELTLAYQHLTEINSCLEAIGGTKFDMEGKYYWSSTQSSSYTAWYWGYKIKYVDTDDKSVSNNVRVFGAL